MKSKTITHVLGPERGAAATFHEQKRGGDTDRKRQADAAKVEEQASAQGPIAECEREQRRDERGRFEHRDEPDQCELDVNRDHHAIMLTETPDPVPDRRY
jgi:hypothetical protein